MKKSRFTDSLIIAVVKQTGLAPRYVDGVPTQGSAGRESAHDELYADAQLGAGS